MPLDDSDDDTGYWLHRPEDVRAAIFELTHPDSHILVRDAADRELAILIRAIDKATQTFLWVPRDYAGADFAENERSVLAGEVFDVLANGYSGVRIRFRIPRPEVVRTEDGSPALLSPFPERLARVQRRRAFRAQATPAALPRALARWTPEHAARPLEFRIRDLSIDGIGLRSDTALADLPAPGSVMEDVTLDFGQAGTLTTCLQVRNVYALGSQIPAVQAGDDPGNAAAHAGPAHVHAQSAATAAPASVKSGEPPLSHLGTAFVDLSPREETWLQQIVWRLEKQRSGK